MACEYISRIVIEQFTNAKTLERALKRLGAHSLTVNGLTVQTRDAAQMDALKQAYATESHLEALRDAGLMFEEQRNAKTGQIQIKVYA